MGKREKEKAMEKKEKRAIEKREDGWKGRG